MNPTRLYLALCVVGAVVPCVLLLPDLWSHGAHPRELLARIFANGAAGAFAVDVIVSSVVFWLFAVVEGRRVGVRSLWAPIAANVLIGLSLGLPLFLYMRERRLERAGERG